MKVNYQILTLTLIAVLLASCSKEDDTDQPQGPNGEKSMTITLAGVDTYAAGDVQASQKEKTVANLSIWFFEKESTADAADGQLVRIEEFNTLNSLTVEVGTTGLDAEYMVYFVANNSGNAFADLSAATVGHITEAEFRNLPTRALTPSAPDVRSDLFLMTGKLPDAIKATGTHSVTLKRRVARFDLVNRNSNIAITKLTIVDANDHTSTFGNSEAALTAGTLNPTPLTDFGTWKAYAENNVVVGEVSESLFYLNPTTIPTPTAIYVEGTKGTGANQQTFILELKPDPAIEIKANYRYYLTVEDDTHLLLEAADWEVASPDEVIYTEPGGFDRFDLWGGGTLDRIGYTIHIGGNVDFELRTTSSLGASWELTPLVEAGLDTYDATKFNVTEVLSHTVTYSRPYYLSKYSFVWNDYPPANGFVSKLRFTDKNSGEMLDFILYYYPDATRSDYYPGTHLPVVKVGGVEWAPVNIGCVFAQEPGQYLQWGHNTHINTHSVAVVNGPTADYPGLHSLVFITNRDELSASHGDWLTADSPLRQAVNQNWVPGASYPCPDGYHVPSKAEFDILIDAYGAGKTSYDAINNTLVFEGDTPGTFLHLPLAGNLDRRTGKLTDAATLGRYWSSDMGTDNANLSVSLDLQLSGGDVQAVLGESPRAMGYSLRCVKN